MLSKILDYLIEEAAYFLKKDKAYKKTSNLYLGQIIEDSNIKCEVIKIHPTNIKVKIIEIKYDRIGTYLDVGKIYPLFKHSGLSDKEMQVWEIASKHMKRSTSQLILQWENKIGWVWELDF